MPIYRIKNNKTIQFQLKEDGFGDEAALRDLFADNLEDLLGIKFIAKEYPTLGGRIDTLGLDENRAPVIIEYKWKQNEEVLAQGLFYYDWLIKNKKHFELLVEKVLGRDVKVNWEQTRVILIAQGFGKFTIGAVQQWKNIELVTYSYYEPDILHLEYLFTYQNEKQQKPDTKKEETVYYDLEYHLSKTSDDLRKKFLDIRSSLLNFPEIEERINQKGGITYRTTKSFVRFEFRQTWIQVLIRDANYVIDTKKMVKDVTKNEWGYNGMFKFTSETDVDYLINLITKSYESTI